MSADLSADPRDEFGAERIAAFYAQAPAASRVNLLLGGVATTVMWGHAPTAQLLAWIVAVITINGLRLATWAAWSRDTHRDARWRTWARRCVLAMLASGTAWGFGAAAMVTLDSPLLMAFWVIMIAGIAAGVVAANAFYLPALWAYLFPLLLPVALRVALGGGFEHLAIFVGLSLFIVFCVQQGRHQAELVLESFRMRSENRSLMAQLREESRAANLARDEAEAAASAKARFFSAASHDLRQPLQAISMYAAGLNHAPIAESELRLVRGISESAGTLTSLFDELLEIARLDNRAIAYRPARVPLQRVFDKLESLFAPLAQSGATRLHIRPTRHAVLADELLLTRLLGNLVSNGLKYAAGGTVAVLPRQRGERLAIEVRDNGPGIRLDQQQLIFEEFYQASNAARDSRLGFGLGLPSAARIAVIMGGKLLLRSAPARGSVFWIDLPLAAPSRQG